MLGIVVLGLLAALPLNDRLAPIAVLRALANSLIVVALVAAVGLPVAMLVIRSGPFYRLVRDAGNFRWGVLVQRVVAALDAYRGRSWILVAGLGLSVVSHFMVAVALYLLAQGTGAGSLSLTSYSFAVPLTVVVNMLPVTPGGIGIGESAFGAICRLLDGGALLTAYGTLFLLYRVIGVLALLPGLVLALTWRGLFRD
jgi:hypothetical protein